jgi:hypothetical protein
MFWRKGGRSGAANNMPDDNGNDRKDRRNVKSIGRDGIGLAATLLFLSGGARVATAQTTQVLYDAASGVTPTASVPQWLTFGAVPNVAQTFTPGLPSFTRFDTTASEGTYAGYSNRNASVAPAVTPPFFTLTPTTLVNPAFPNLDRAAGFNLQFTMRLNSETHAGNPVRAGFSVILLGSDRLGVEVGFQSDTLFAQAPGFGSPAAESVSGAAISALTGAFTTYDLSIAGNTYTLRNGATTLLTGAVKDYTAATGFAGDVYRTPNFLFLGDDTTSASASTDLNFVRITTNAVAPEPASLALFGVVLPGVLAARRRRRGR